MRISIAVLATLAGLTLPAQAQLEFSIGGRLGTLGAELSAGIRGERLGVRAGAGFASWSYRQKAGSVSFENQVKFTSRSAIADFYPTGGSFHISGGVTTAPVEMAGRGRPSINKMFTINGHIWSETQTGTVIGVAEWPDILPYAGLGWSGSMSGDRLKVTFDVGAAFGGPDFSLTSTNAAAGSQLATDLEAEAAKIQNDLDNYAKIFPVVSLGLRVRL